MIQPKKNLKIHYTLQPCWLGWVLVATIPRGICAISLGDTTTQLQEDLRNNFPQVQLQVVEGRLQFWSQQVMALIEAPHQAADLPLEIQGTPFQKRVWQMLQTIPAGATLSYGELADRLGNPKAVRAVAQACGRNRLAVAIPCHRVVGSDGSLRGYRWGCDRKRALLEKETIATALPPAGSP